MTNSCIITITVIGCITFLLTVERVCECIEKRDKDKDKKENKV